ncbi:S1C family serine protease [Nocardioides pantholopis]|uniref:S1C family serine protease n=1 Tax=Nocardioides pantholopis TaxID=2483798 RepID=UPI001F4937B2|nr:trypsin-like peptidase domain-containing protein [Nocardioides pantholopis]
MPPQGAAPAGSSGPSSGSKGRGGLAAAVVAGSLVVGALAGFGGAAAWDAFDDDDEASTSSSSTSSSQDQNSQVGSGASTDSVEAVAAKVLPSVVKIDVTSQQGAGSGSGIVLTADGRILTNDHVVSGAGQGGTISVSFSDGSRADAEVVGTDPLTDVAVIQAQDVDDLTPASLGNSDDLAIGEEVVAVGSPYGLDATVTSGIISALNRPVNVGQNTEGNTTAYPAIQTDAAINPGNSGGPLVDMDGNVVGMNSSILSNSSSSGEAGSIGLGFAIPIDAALPIVEQIVAGEEPTHAILGITVSDASGVQGGNASASPSEGALIREVSPQSAAGQAGLEAGDVITRIDDHPVTGADSLVATIRSYRPGDTVTVVYERGGEEESTDLTLDSDGDS